MYWLNIYITAKSGVHPSLRPNCHHQIISAEFNLKIYYSPPYLREVWHSREANADLIKRAISNFNWQKVFSNTNINEKVFLFNKMILTLSWRSPLSYKNQSIDLLCKSMGCFLYDNGLRHERVKHSQGLYSSWNHNIRWQISPWFNSQIKSLIENKNKIRKNYQRCKYNSQLLNKLKLLQEQLYLLINKSKQKLLLKSSEQTD